MVGLTIGLFECGLFECGLFILKLSGVCCELCEVCDRVLELFGAAELLLLSFWLLLLFLRFLLFASLIPFVCGSGKVDELKFVWLEVAPETLEAPV